MWTTNCPSGRWRDPLPDPPQARHCLRQIAELQHAEMPAPLSGMAVTDRGVAKLDATAARFIKRANAPWSRKFAGNGVEVIGVFKAVDNSRDAGGDREWRVLRTAEWRAAQGEVHGEDDQ